MHGILSVQFDRKSIKFKRKWVTNAEGEVLLYTGVEAASKAEAMSQAARDEGIKDQGYRARWYDGKASI